jgi:hypothetical protein
MEVKTNSDGSPELRQEGYEAEAASKRWDEGSLDIEAAGL